MRQCWAKGSILSLSWVLVSSAMEESQVFPMCVDRGDRTLPPYVLVKSAWVPSLCFSLQSVFPVGTSRLRTDRGTSGLLTPWQST